MFLKSINPVNGKVGKKYKLDTEKQVSRKINKASAAWEHWKKTPFDERKGFMLKTAEILRNEKKHLAGLMAIEMGKPVKEGIVEIEKCATVCEYYAANGESFLQDKLIEAGASKSYVSYQPLGVVLAIMPWNFPFWQCFRFIAPALIAGNCGLLKHASNVPGCALAIQDVLKKAGFPSGVFQTLMVSSKEIHRVIENPVIKAVTLTGSTEAGKAVAQQAGGLIKKTVLELGGSDPYIILEDADLDYAAGVCAESRLINNGQSCIGAKRIIVIKEREKEFVRLLKNKMESFKIGDPFDSETQLGPMASVKQRDGVHQQVLKTVEDGAKCILGGYIPNEEGEHAFYVPTILVNVKKGMLTYEDEIFGPVASIITAKNKEEAIKIANDSVFGLGAAIFTENIREGERIAREEIQSGSCFVNTLVKSDPRLPFGGINLSGYGRELSFFGIKEFVNIKTVLIK